MMKKIKIKHLLSNPEEEREQISIKSISVLGKYDNIEYEKIVNPPYTELPPKENCDSPEVISMNLFDEEKTEKFDRGALTPTHYGCYKAHTDAILSCDNDSDTIYLFFECDAVLSVEPNIFIDKVYEASRILEKNKYLLFSFGYSPTDSLEYQGHLTSTTIFQTHSYLVLGENIDYFKEKIKTSKWDVIDLWLTYIIKEKIGFFKESICFQVEGISLLDRAKKGEKVTISNPKTKITVLLATCDRYETTLPLCLMSIFNQNYPPERIVLIDDSKQKKFYDYPILKNILILFKEKGIDFDYFYGPSKGAVHAFQIGLDNIEDGWIFKTDDDNILSCDILDLFVKNIEPNIGAMSGVIIDKYLYSFYENNPDKRPVEEDGYYNKIENIYSEFNIQMVHDQSNDIKKVQHIYSNYFFRRELADNYNLELSPSSHREETIFTYNIFRKGYDLIIIPKAKIYHLGGDNRSGNRQWGKINEKKNELFFIEKLKEWNIIPNKMQIIDDGEKMYVTKKGKKYLVVLW